MNESEKPAMDLSRVPFKPYYQDEYCVIYNADCRQVLPFLPKFDLLLTDPPYGIGESSKKVASRGRGSKLTKGRVYLKDYGRFDWDNSPPDNWLLDQMIASADHAIIWGGNFFGLPPSSCWAVWDKDNTGDFADCELAWTNIPKAVRKFRFRWNGMLQERMGDDKEIRVHPTQKPVPLFRWCLGYFCKSDTVLDCYGGSLTTAVAAKLENKFAVVIEASEAYCEKGVKRLEQGVLF